MSDSIVSSPPSPDPEVAALRAERDLLRAEITETRHRLELMLDSTGAACGWEWDIAGQTLTADARFAAITRQDPIILARGAPTSSFFAHIHPDDIKRIRLAIAAILSGAEMFSKEYRLLKEDGGFRWVQARGRTIFDTHDKPVRFVGMLVDITEQKRAQEQLRIAQTAGGIGTFERVMGFATVNVSAQFCELFGLHPTKLLSIRTIDSVLNPEDATSSSLTAPVGIGEKSDLEFRVLRADDGSERWLARRGEYVEDPNSAGRRYIGAIYDITSAKQTQARLREVNNALARRVRERTRERDRIWQNARDLIVVIGTDGELRDVNPAWTDILGHGTREIIGRSILDFTVPEDVERTRAALARAISEAHTDLELRHLHKDGSHRWISWMTSNENDLIYAYGRNITFEKEQARILLETEAQLRQAQKMEAVGQLTGGIAHDFNNMLTGIIGALSILRRRIATGKTDDVDRFIDAANASAHRAAALTHRLLAFSRRQSLDRRPLDINALVLSMEDLLLRTIGEQITLRLDLGTDIVNAVTDANQLESAILNLVINARDAMPDGGTLLISTGNATLPAGDFVGGEELLTGSYVTLSVRDTGIGMSDDTIAKVFEPFFTTKPIGQGTGLGLSMIYGFVQQSGGQIRIDSDIGRGTAIELFLPGTRAEAEHDAYSATGETSLPMGDGETVLVVEDDKEVRMLVVEVLKDLGYRTIEATESKEALPVIESRQRIDLMISDVGLPGLNGRQLADIARTKRPGLRILFVTGYAANATSRGDFLAPGMDMITKPFAVDHLARKVREMLGTEPSL